MKNRIKTFFALVIFVSAMGVSGLVNAAGPSLFVSPANSNVTSGDTFDAAVGVHAAGSKVYAVEGQFVLGNLSCDNVTMAPGVTAQTTPTCASSYFLIGIPTGTTVDQALFTVFVKAKNSGQGSLSFTGVDIIGEGKSLGSASEGGNFTIKAVSIPIPAPAVTPSTTEPKAMFAPSPAKKTVTPMPVKKVISTTTNSLASTTSNSLNPQVAATAEATPKGGIGFWVWAAIALVALGGVWCFSVFRKRP